LARTPIYSKWSLRTPIADPATVFSVVADVERYCEFMPGVGARILRRDGPRWEVENTFGVGPLNTRFVSLAEVRPPSELTIVSNDGPCRAYSTHWLVTPDEAGCVLECETKIEFRSLALDIVARVWFERGERAVMAAFDRRLKSFEGSGR